MGERVIYVAEQGGGRILEVALDGSADREIASGLGGPYAIAVAASGDLIVTLRDTGAVVRIRDGVVTELASGQARPGRIVVAGIFAYWIDEGVADGDGALRRVAIEGGAVEDLATALAAPRGLAITSTRCYVTETGAQQLGWVPIEGGTITGLVDGDGTPLGVAVDEAAGQVYWTAPGRRGGGWLRRTDLDLTTNVRVSFSPPGPSVILLDVDSVLWSTSQTLSSAPRAGGAYEDLAIEAAVCDFAVDASALYWTDPQTGRLLSTPRPAS